MRIPMVVESVADHTHMPTGMVGISARCRMAVGFPVAVAVASGPIAITPVYSDIVMDFIGPSGTLKEGQIFDIELRAS